MKQLKMCTKCLAEVAEEKEDGSINMVGDNDSNICNRDKLTITSEDGTEYSFEAPEFDIVLFSTYEEYVYGRRGLVPFRLKLSTGAAYMDQDLTRGYVFKLTPIKKPWYEDEANFPALVKHHNLVWVAYSKGEVKDATLATKQEVESLYYEGRSDD